MRVCLVLEGSYPYVTGGVSSWMHQLIRSIPGVDFVLLTLSPKPDQDINYELPPNVVDHVDIVISESSKSSARAGRKSELMREIQTMHEAFTAGSRIDIKRLIELIPEGYFLTKDSYSSELGWELVTQGHLHHNPIYPFADYFWAWKSVHDMFFTVIGARLPQADIYHAISTGYAGLAATVAKARFNKPFLLTEHGLYHKEREMEIRRVRYVRGYQRDMWIKAYNGLSRISYQCADLVISLFEYNRRAQVAMGAPEGKTLVVANGIDVDRYSKIERQPRDGFHVGLVGRVVPIKDIKTFIAMCKIVHDRHPEARFYCIGPVDEDPAYYEDCRTMVKSFRLESTFTFTGSTNVLEYYAFLDVLLLTSVREAQPLVILEAYAAGIPVVATRVGNVPELLDYDDRFLASSKDPEKLAAAVTYVHDNPHEMRDLVDANKAKTTQFYDRDDVHHRYEQIYEKLVKERTWPG